MEDLETGNTTQDLFLSKHLNHTLKELDDIDGGKIKFHIENPQNEYESENEESEWVLNPRIKE